MSLLMNFICFIQLFQPNTIDLDISNIDAWDAAKELVDEEEIRNVFVDDLFLEPTLNIPKKREAREAPELPGKWGRVTIGHDSCTISFMCTHSFENEPYGTADLHTN